nr:hypothetical protein CFP56_61171 [Quercus suber]
MVENGSSGSMWRKVSLDQRCWFILFSLWENCWQGIEIYKEYPPGVKLAPIGSKTAKPFRTTNLIIFALENVSNESENNSFVACGDALIVDPVCRSEFHEELQKIVAALPRKLVVFVTHHHRDHVDGLSIVQKCNPNATLLVHENTMRHIGKGYDS